VPGRVLVARRQRRCGEVEGQVRETGRREGPEVEGSIEEVKTVWLSMVVGSCGD
jgi:hypothetical protein